MSLSLDCWGHDWEWLNCKNILLPQVPLKRLSLAPFTSHSLRLNLASLDTPHSSADPLYLMTQQGQDESDITMATNFFIDEDLPDTRVLLTRLTEEETLIVNDVNPNQIYRITLAPHKNINASTVFFKINDNGTDPWSAFPNSQTRTLDGDLLARVEEISIVVLILALWMVAIALFVHRWGKIRMLEPYQPDYKAAHDPNCPLNPSTSPPLIVPPTSPNAQRSRPPTFKALPRKSSSLCFTPSMLRAIHMPSNCGVSVPRLDTYQPQTLRSHPASRIALHKIRGRMSVDSPAQRSVQESDFCRLARSAENLKHTRQSASSGRNLEDIYGGRHSSNLENSRSSSRQGMPSSGVVLRGASLDSSQPIVRKNSGKLPYWTQGMGVSSPYPEGRTTPEIRISPTPPESSYLYSRSGGKDLLHSRPPGLQRQEPLDETLLPPVPYATLHEEEDEADEGAVAIDMSHESLQSQEFHTGYSSQESQEEPRPSQHDLFKWAQQERKLTHMSQVTQSTSQESQANEMESMTGSRDSCV